MNGIRTNQNQSLTMRRIQFSGILKYKRITWFWPKDFVLINKKKKRFFVEFVVTVY